MRDVFKEIKEANGLSTVDPMLVPLSDVFDLQGMYKMKQNERQYLKGKYDHVSVIIPAAGDPGYEPSIKPVVDDRPIAMLDINGKPVLQRNVETLKGAGLKNIHVVTGTNLRCSALTMSTISIILILHRMAHLNLSCWLRMRLMTA